MSNRPHPRALAFEQLETKSTPSSLLLALAPVDDSQHAALEQLQDHAAESTSVVAVDTSSRWHFQITTLDLLRFVDDHTTAQDADSGCVPHPTTEDCQRVDVMMRLSDDEVRALVVSDTLTHP